MQRKQERGEAVRQEREEMTAQMFARKVEQMEVYSAVYESPTAELPVTCNIHIFLLHRMT